MMSPLCIATKNACMGVPPGSVSMSANSHSSGSSGLLSKRASGASLLSVIICTFNRASLLSGCLKELVRQIQEMARDDVDILIVDNNSTDDTALIFQQFKAKWPSLRYVFEPSQGLSYARNRGAIESSGLYVCYIDDDAVPGAYYVQSVMSVLAMHAPDIAGGPIFPFYTSPKPFWFQDELEVRQHARGTGFFDCPVSGGNFIIRRELLLHLGMFSTEYGMVGGRLRLGEERNLIERYRKSTSCSRRRIYYSQACFVYHHVPVSKMKISYFLRRAFESGRMRMMLSKEHGNERSEGAIAPSNSFGGRLRRILWGEKSVYLPLRLLHIVALAAGMMSVHAQIKLSTLKKRFDENSWSGQ